MLLFSQYIPDIYKWPEIEEWYLLGLKEFLKYEIKVRFFCCTTSILFCYGVSLNFI